MPKTPCWKSCIKKSPLGVNPSGDKCEFLSINTAPASVGREFILLGFYSCAPAANNLVIGPFWGRTALIRRVSPCSSKAFGAVLSIGCPYSTNRLAACGKCFSAFCWYSVQSLAGFSAFSYSVPAWRKSSKESSVSFAWKDANNSFSPEIVL